MDDSAETVVEISAALAATISSLYQGSNCARYEISQEQFSGILKGIAEKQAAGAGHQQICDLYASLHVEDLVLARACAAGNERAWQDFMARFREKLYTAANYVAKESSAGRELADALYADLYGTTVRDGRRVSKLASYTGRGSLEGWLRTVLAQEFVNRYRKQRRLVSLDEESEEGAQFAAPDPEPSVAVDSRLTAATDGALGALPPEDRYLLASYYLDGRTLAAIARSLSVHESTISRRLDKLAKGLRKQILATLVQQGMSRRQAEEALDLDVRDLQVDIRNRLAQKVETQPFSEKEAEAGAGDG